MSPQIKDAAGSHAQLDAVVVGAGFAGLYALYRLRNVLQMRVCILEAGSGVGGTWYWNRYPGCRCDVPSHYYSYSFSSELDQEWTWSEKFASQPEIEKYLNHVADRFDLRSDIRFNARVISARYDEAENRWCIETDDGEQVTARFLITAVGVLSAAHPPDIPGIDSFRGNSYFSGQWPHERVDFHGQRVAVIGTGSTGIQIVPVLAQEAAEVTVFQRTPNYSIPARNAPMSAAEARRVKAEYPAIRSRERQSPSGLPVAPPDRSALEVSDEERREIYETLWQGGGVDLLIGSFNDLVTNRAANATISEFVADKIRERVQDPQLAERFVPDHPFGTRRPALDTGYFEAFNRANVSLVDLRETPLEAVTPSGIRTSKTEYAFDSIIYATGFDGFTGSLVRMGIRGRGGLALEEYWRDGPRTFLGLASRYFPNMFMVTGPQSGVQFNLARNIEQHIEWITDCISYMTQNGYASIEPEEEAQTYWNDLVNRLADATLIPETNSWWIGTNVPGKPRVILRYIGGAVGYQTECKRVVEEGYSGFVLAPERRTEPSLARQA